MTDDSGRRRLVKDDESPSLIAANDKARCVNSPQVQLASAGLQDARVTPDLSPAFQGQELDDKARKLLACLITLPGFEFAEELDYGDYKHMGATITASILQAGMNWKNTVEPRVERLIRAFPEAATTTGFLALLEREGHAKVLGWSDSEKPNRILGVARFFQAHGVDTEAALREWLLCDGNAHQLLNLRGVGDKTVDFFKILVRIQTNAVDRHLKNLLVDAGIQAKTYRECHAVIDRTADLRGVDRILLDFSIWKHMSERKRKPQASRHTICRRTTSR